MSKTQPLQRELFDHQVSMDHPVDELEEAHSQQTSGLEVTKTDLYRLNVDDLGIVLTGAHNLDIPPEMVEILNSGEGIAKYFSGGWVKPNPILMRRFPREFIELNRKLDDYAFPNIGYALSDFRKRFPIRSGDQIARLQGLDSSVQEAFIDSFYSPFRPIPNDRDPRGRDKKSRVDRIYNLVN